MNERERIGHRIAEIRKSKGISQEQLAQIAEITQNNLSRIENGKYSPGFDVLAKIATALEKTIDFI